MATSSVTVLSRQQEVVYGIFHDHVPLPALRTIKNETMQNFKQCTFIIPIASSLDDFIARRVRVRALTEINEARLRYVGRI